MGRFLVTVTLSCSLAAPAAAQVVPYFPPPNLTYNFSTGELGVQAQTLATCAANQVVYDNASGKLVCSAQMTFNPTGANLQVGAAGGTVASVDLYAASAATDAHKTRFQVNSAGTFSVVPLNDAGTVTAGNALTLGRTGNAFSSFSYADTTQGTTFQISGSDMVFTGQANGQPILLFRDPGSVDALAGMSAFTGGGGPGGNELAMYCVSNAFSLGAGLLNGPANNYCQVSTGDQLFAAAPSLAPLTFGSGGGIYGGMLDQSQNWVLDRATSHATNQTNGFVYLPKTAGVPTGTPANLTGQYNTSAPVILDSTDARLYGYFGGAWNPLTTVFANPTASIGLTAVNGVATTALPSDAAPALSLAIAPNLASPWTSSPWDWSNAEPRQVLTESDQGADLKNWDWDLNGGLLCLRTRTDADAAGVNVLCATRGTTTAITNLTWGNATSNPTFTLSGTGTLTTGGGITVGASSTTISLGGSITTGLLSVNQTSVPTNGIYRPATNTLGFATNSTLRGSYDANGKWVVNSGYLPDAGGLKHQRVTTGSVGAASTALVTCTWTTGFADTNYTAQASVEDSTTTSLSLSVVHIESKATGSMTVRVLNNAAGALTGTVDCLGIHD